MARQRFQSGIGGTLRLLPEEVRLAGRPSAATVSIKTSTGLDLPTPVASATATVDPVDTTLASPASEGDRFLRVTSAIGIRVGGRYLISCQDGDRIDVQVSGVQGTVVQLLAALLRSLQAGDGFQGVELSYALTGVQCPAPSSAALDLEDAVEPPPGYGHSYRAVWAYTIGGQAAQADQLYEVRLRLLRPTLTADQVARVLPADWPDLVPGGPDEIAAILSDAWDDLLVEVEGKGFDPDRIMDVERLRVPHRSRVLWMLGISWPPAWREWTADRAKEAEQDLDSALNSGAWYDKRDDAVQTKAEQKWSSVRLSR